MSLSTVVGARHFSSPSPPSSPSSRSSSSSSHRSSPEPISVDVTALLHPLAASNKAIQAPPQHERKTSTTIFTSPIAPPANIHIESSTKKYRVYDASKDSAFFFDPSQTPFDREMEIWDQAITKVVDSGSGVVTLRSVRRWYLNKLR